MDVQADSLERQIAEWRGYLRRSPAVATADVEELETHLRDQVDALAEAGLTPDEAFLVAVKRLGHLDALSREFAREHSERLWKQLVLSSEEGDGRAARRELTIVVALAVAAAAAVKLPAFAGLDLYGSGHSFYALNLSLLVLPFLVGYLAWKRRLGVPRLLGLLAPVAVAAAVVNAYPFAPGGSTFWLAALHLPIALWLVAGLAYTGASWRDGQERMSFVRFSGELFIYYVLIALGGGVLSGFTAAMFQAIGLRADPLIAQWLLPCGAAGAVLIGAWLVEAKQGVIENMAPVLTRVFTPLFTLVLLAFLGTMVWTGRGIGVERDVLIGFDLLLAVILGLVLYAVSARDPLAPPSVFDGLQLVLVVSALVADLAALAAIVSRIADLGFTPNRTAALGENLLLLVALAVSAWRYARFIGGRGTFHELEGWQTSYLPVFSLWAAVVVVLFPLVFGFE